VQIAPMQNPHPPAAATRCGSERRSAHGKEARMAGLNGSGGGRGSASLTSWSGSAERSVQHKASVIKGCHNH